MFLQHSNCKRPRFALLRSVLELENQKARWFAVLLFRLGKDNLQCCALRPYCAVRTRRAPRQGFVHCVDGAGARVLVGFSPHVCGN
jgi:hypothetical protein